MMWSETSTAYTGGLSGNRGSVGWVEWSEPSATTPRRGSMMVPQELNPSYAPSLRRDNGRADIAHRPPLREFSATPPADHGNQRPARSARPVRDQPTGLAPPPCGGHGTSAAGA